MTGRRTGRFAMDRRYPAIAALAAVAIAARLQHLSDRSIWFDDASSSQTASYDWDDFLRIIRLNVHLPLYYLLLKDWMALFGESAAALRSFSVAFGVPTVILIVPFAGELFRTSAACRPEDGESDAEPAGVLSASSSRCSWHSAKCRSLHRSRRGCTRWARRSPR
jgi:uncharacterized membrane protein